MRTRLVLVRHAQTASNGPEPDPRMSGWTDLPLSPLGYRQAEALHQRLLSEPPAAAIYTSPLQRARHTADKMMHSSRGPLEVMLDLREINCGEADGLRISEAQRRHPALWRKNLQQEDEHFRWPGGESYRELRTRSLAVIGKIAAENPGNRVLVVTHAGVISQILGALEGLSPARWEPFRPQNASLTEIDWGEEGCRLVSFNDHAHLAHVQPVAPAG